MALPSVASGDEVKSDDVNVYADLLNGAAGGGQPGKLYDFNDPATYSLVVGNQDTTNGLIQSWQYGTVGAATAVARATKQGIIGKLLPSAGSWIFVLDSFSTSTLNAATTASATTASDAAWTAAFAAVAAVGGGTIMLGPGTYLAPTIGVTTWVSNTIIRGAGIDATTILHPGYTQAGNTNREAIYYLGLSNCGLADLTINGNRTNNNGTTTGFDSSEVSLDGTNNWMYRVKVKDFNKNGVGATSGGVAVIGCKIGLTAPPSVYSATTTKDYGGFYGIQTGSFSGEQDLVIADCEIYGLRTGGIFVGGKRITIDNCHVYDCHREYNPSATATGGGQIAIGPTGNSGGRSQWITISNCQVGPSTLTPSCTSGIEINGCDYVNIVGCNVDGTPGAGNRLVAGIVLDQGATHIAISNGTISNCVTGLSVLATAGLPVKKWGVSNVSFASNSSQAIFLATTIDEFTLQGCRFAGNTVNWSAAGLTGVNWQSDGHVISDGGDVPHQSYRNITATFVKSFTNASSSGHGIYVRAGSSASEFAIECLNAANTAVLLNVYGSGQVSIGGPVNGQLLNVQTLTELTTIAAAATTDTAILMPAGAIILGVSVRVTVAIPTAATFTVGDSGSAARFSTAAVGVALNSTDPGTKAGAYYNATALAVRITPNINPASNVGRVRVTVTYLSITPPTS